MFGFLTRYLLAWVLVLASTQSVALAKTPSNNTPPNILIILTDDQGWGDLGFHGNNIIETPTLDKLFEQNTHASHFYVSPVCAPTRASLLTGRHSLATGVWSVTRGGEKMHSEELTLAEHLKSQGYRTGLFGKWHNGSQYPHNPNGQGFDEFYGFVEGHQTRYFDAQLQHNGHTVDFSGFMPDRLTDATIDFVRSDSEQPFFAMLAFNTPHSPFSLPEALLEKYRSKGIDDLQASVYGMMENIDSNTTRVLNALDTSRKRDNTIVIYLSDNGPAFPKGIARFNSGLKGWKGSLHEGGVRVPFVISWPKGLAKPLKLDAPMQHIDLAPTLLSLAGLTPMPNVDGRNLSNYLKGGAEPETEALFIHHLRNTQRPDQEAIQASPGAVRHWPWLAAVDHAGNWSLYDLARDETQQHAVTNQTETLEKLKQLYIKWYQSTTEAHGAYTPLPIELGHKQAPNTYLPSHEAIITDEGLDYANGAGWSHDWLRCDREEKGQVYWPIKVVREGQYQIDIEYATTTTDNTAIDFTGVLQVSTANQTQQVTQLPGYYAPNLPETRWFQTGEAEDHIWHRKTFAPFSLRQTDNQLTISIDCSESQLLIKGLSIKGPLPQ